MGGRIGYAYGTPAMGLDYLTGMEPSKGYADGGRIGFKAGSGKKILSLIIIIIIKKVIIFHYLCLIREWVINLADY
jgi:hypothetical protein